MSFMKPHLRFSFRAPAQQPQMLLPFLLQLSHLDLNSHALYKPLSLGLLWTNHSFFHVYLVQVWPSTMRAHILMSLAWFSTVVVARPYPTRTLLSSTPATNSSSISPSTAREASFLGRCALGMSISDGKAPGNDIYDELEPRSTCRPWKETSYPIKRQQYSALYGPNGQSDGGPAMEQATVSPTSPPGGRTKGVSGPTSKPSHSLVPNWSYKKHSIAAAIILIIVLAGAVVILLVLCFKKTKRYIQRRKKERDDSPPEYSAYDSPGVLNADAMSSSTKLHLNGKDMGQNLNQGTFSFTVVSHARHLRGSSSRRTWQQDQWPEYTALKTTFLRALTSHHIDLIYLTAVFLRRGEQPTTYLILPRPYGSPAMLRSRLSLYRLLWPMPYQSALPGKLNRAPGLWRTMMEILAWKVQTKTNESGIQTRVRIHRGHLTCLWFIRLARRFSSSMVFKLKSERWPRLCCCFCAACIFHSLSVQSGPRDMFISLCPFKQFDGVVWFIVVLFMLDEVLFCSFSQQGNQL